MPFNLHVPMSFSLNGTSSLCSKVEVEVISLSPTGAVQLSNKKN